MLGGILALIAAVALPFHSKPAPTPKTKQAWKTGFWLWAGEPPAASELKPEVLYVEARGPRWPKELPPADEYVVARRIEPPEALTRQLAGTLAEDYRALLTQPAVKSTIAGLQIDYDCPTGKLQTYARFLEWLREALPAGSRLSITALLDWFGPKTAIAEVVGAVDEFVPQFYDAGSSRTSSGIGSPIDSVKWAPIFNAYGTPYRIGISSFGRISRKRTDADGHMSVNYFRDASPLDFAERPELKSSTTTTASGEIVVHYEVVAPIPNKPELSPGDVLEITFPTETSIGTSIQAVRAFGGYNAGVIFFRWPSRSETLTLSPEDVQRIALAKPASAFASLEVRSAPCIERHCSDLYLSPHAVNANAQTLGIRTIGPMELFLPGDRLHTFPVAPKQLAVQIPAYSGFGKIYLGRIISSGSIRFEEFQP
jgi:hypothetical protein